MSLVDFLFNHSEGQWMLAICNGFLGFNRRHSCNGSSYRLHLATNLDICRIVLNHGRQAHCGHRFAIDRLSQEAFSDVSIHSVGCVGDRRYDIHNASLDAEEGGMGAALAAHVHDEQKSSTSHPQQVVDQWAVAHG